MKRIKTNTVYNNVLKSDVNGYGKNANLYNANKYELLKYEMEKMNNNMEQLNNTLKTIIVEILNEKSINDTSMNSAITALERYQNLKLEQNTQNGESYKENLDTTAKELKNILIENKYLQKRYLYTRINMLVLV